MAGISLFFCTPYNEGTRVGISVNRVMVFECDIKKMTEKRKVSQQLMTAVKDATSF